MAADLGNLESLRINDPREQATQPEATLASLPEDLWRRIAGYVAPRDSARNLLVASGRSSSLRGALLADIERTERALYGDTFLRVTGRYCSLGLDAAGEELFGRILKIHVWLRAFFELAEGRPIPTSGFTDGDVDSRVLARVVSERTRERFRNAIIDGINAGLAAVINMGVTEGFDADAIAEAIDADSEIAEGLNRLVEESVEEQIGDANADAAEA